MGPTRHDRGGKYVENMASSMLCKWEDVPRRGILLYLPTSLRTDPGAGFICEVCELTEVRLCVATNYEGRCFGRTVWRGLVPKITQREERTNTESSKLNDQGKRPSLQLGLWYCDLCGLSPWCAIHWLYTLRTVHGIVNIGGRLLTGVLADQAHTSGLRSKQRFRGAASRTNPTPRNRRDEPRCALQASTPAPSFRQLAVDTDGTEVVPVQCSAPTHAPQPGNFPRSSARPLGSDEIRHKEGCGGVYLAGFGLDPADERP